MSQTTEEKLEILNEVMPEVMRFSAKAVAFQKTMAETDGPEFSKIRSWRALQRATTDLREVLAHLTRVPR